MSTSLVDLESRRGQRGQINQCYRSRRYGRLRFTGRRAGRFEIFAHPVFRILAKGSCMYRVSIAKVCLAVTSAKSTRRRRPKSRRIAQLLSNEVQNGSRMAITWNRGLYQLRPTIIFHDWLPLTTFRGFGRRCSLTTLTKTAAAPQQRGVRQQIFSRRSIGVPRSASPFRPPLITSGTSCDSWHAGLAIPYTLFLPAGLAATVP